MAPSPHCSPIPTPSRRTAAMCRPPRLPVSRFQAVSKGAETGKTLKINGNNGSVSLFHRFRGRRPAILNRGGRAGVGRPHGEAWSEDGLRGSHAAARVARDGALQSEFRQGRRPPSRHTQKINARAFPGNPETVKQAAETHAKSTTCRFHVPLKPLETVKQPNQTAPIRPESAGVAHA